MDYKAFVDRNWGYIKAEHQEQIRTTRLLITGCGLGSNIASLAVRTGFTKFTLADGDNVEINNLNRQTFRVEHLGKNKAEVTAQLIREVNPDTEINIIPNYISNKEAEGLVRVLFDPR